MVLLNKLLVNRENFCSIVDKLVVFTKKREKGNSIVKTRIESITKEKNLLITIFIWVILSIF